MFQRQNAPTSHLKAAFAFQIDVRPNKKKKKVSKNPEMNPNAWFLQDETPSCLPRTL